MKNQLKHRKRNLRKWKWKKEKSVIYLYSLLELEIVFTDNNTMKHCFWDIKYLVLHLSIIYQILHFLFQVSINVKVLIMKSVSYGHWIFSQMEKLYECKKLNRKEKGYPKCFHWNWLKKERKFLLFMMRPLHNLPAL